MGEGLDPWVWVSGDKDKDGEEVLEELEDKGREEEERSYLGVASHTERRAGVRVDGLELARERDESSS